MTIRLNKVTRDLNVGITTAVEFLQKKGFTVEANPNTKITDEQFEMLKKEFSTDKDLKIKSERFSQERQNKERNKASVSIEGYGNEEQEHAKVEEIKTVIPEDVRPKFKPVGKIDLDKLNHKHTEVSEPQEETAPQTEEPAEEKPAETPVATTPEPEAPATPEPVVTEPVSEPEVQTPVEEETSAETFETEHTEAEETAEDKTVHTPANEDTQTAETTKEEKKEEEIFKLHKPEFVSRINVIGQIDLAALNQSTRPKKKSKEEKRKEREEKEKQRQDQKKLMKEAIIKEIRREDGKNKDLRDGEEGNGKKKRVRINKEKVDISNASNFQRNDRSKNNTPGGNPAGSGKKNKDRFKKPVIKQEVSEEDVAKQVKETLARLTAKGKNKAAKYRKEKRELDAERRQELESQEQAESKVLKLTEFVTANELASMMNVPVTQVIGTCMSVGIMVSINQRLDAETINLVAEEFGFKTEYISAEVAQAIVEEADAEEDLQPRAPIVTVMGHVDHGKTSLLDYIRKSNVIAGEAGGITQHIGAYHVTLEDGRKITFLDTPGHEAFTAMRARGAKVTDVVIVIVAADDNVMPQTKEAINHAMAAGVPIVFAINKIDKPAANPDKIKEELANMNYQGRAGQHELPHRGMGRQVPVAGHLRQEGHRRQRIAGEGAAGGRDARPEGQPQPPRHGLEKVLLEAEMLDLKANPNRRATGSIIESSLDKGRGYVATVLVSNGTLRVGDIVLAGTHYGKVKAMFNERNQRMKEAGPSEPALILARPNPPSSWA